MEMESSDQCDELRWKADTFKAMLLKLKPEVKNVLSVLRNMMTTINKTRKTLEPLIVTLYLEFNLLQPHMDEVLSDVAKLNSDFNLLLTGKDTKLGTSFCDATPSDQQNGVPICPDAEDNSCENNFPDIKSEDSTQADDCDAPSELTGAEDSCCENSAPGIKSKTRAKEISTQTDLVRKKVSSDVTHNTRTNLEVQKAQGKAQRTEHLRKKVPRQQALLRLDHSVFHHLVSLPPTMSKARPKRDCKVCYDRAPIEGGKRKRARETFLWCKVCQIPLCIEPCFNDFHNRRNYIIQA